MSNAWMAMLIGLLGLDTTIAFQMLLSQPIFACTILGWVHGDVVLGLEIGTMLQLLWLHIVPAGASTFPEGNLGSMIVAALALQFASLERPHTVFTLALLAGMSVSYLGQRLTSLDRRVNSRLFDASVGAAERMAFRQIAALTALSVVKSWLLMSLLAYLVLLVGQWILPELVAQVPAAWEARLAVVPLLVWGIGIALTVPLVYNALLDKSRRS